MIDKNYIICPKEQCTGCGVCSYVCKHNAISFVVDKYGFKYPKIDTISCIKCGLCRKKCPSLSNIKNEKNTPIKAYACYNLNIEERKASSSGGLGYLLAKRFIEKGGIVYGCAFTPSFYVKHIRCTTIQDIEKLRGSKYVHSEILDVYSKIKEDLNNSKEILFIGTPCQVAGIKSAFPKTCNLFTVDLICHGTPSVQFLKDTLPFDYSNVAHIKFRDGNNFLFSMYSDSNEIVYRRKLNNDMFMKGFFNGITFRPNCFNCLYANNNRVSDITIGDFWGLKSETIVKDENGISLALINTAQGKVLIEEISQKLKIEERPVQEALDGNEQLNHPFKKSVRNNIFRYLYPAFGYNVSLWFTIPEKVLFMKIKNLLNK